MTPKTTTETLELPILPVRQIVVFPYVIFPIVVQDAALAEMINQALLHRKLVGVVTEKPGTGDDVELFRVGTAATVLKKFTMQDGTTRLLIQGVYRFEIEELQETPIFRARVKRLNTRITDPVKVEALRRAVQDLAMKVIEKSPFLPDQLAGAVMEASNAERLADLIAANLNIQIEERQMLLEELELDRRLQLVMEFLDRELKVLEITGEIQEIVNEELSRNQREFLLREQLKAIKQELGEDDEELDEWEREIEELRKQIKAAGMPEEVEAVALKELERMAEMSPAAADYPIARTYIDWLISLPWNKETKDNMDLQNAKKILDEDHFDLEDVKNRILEFLAVRKLKKETKGPILCFAGPPGVGKTSLGRSIARAIGRKFVRFSVGGIHDEAEIRGHRRTYIGALPGRIIQMIKEAGTRNPVFMLDEVDKIGTDFRGDPASALLEALDPEQNKDFVDHYLDVKFDLSHVMFICTANVLYNIPPALLDRMEVIEIPGYITEEKVEIARKYIVPRKIEESGLKKKHVRITKKAIEKIITDYTNEAGVRNLEREIATICRKIARRVAEGKDEPVKITPDNLKEFLGPPKNFPELAGIKDEIGIATGLAWTPVGGEILFIESTLMKGGKNLVLTGQLGEVMRESAQAALSYLRSNAERYGIDPDFFAKYDVHIHVPSGAVPKDGPSAGVTIATSLLSLLIKQPVRHDVAMTGEISLRGRVLPVGGIKEKVIAARRAGIKTVILPQRNEKDLQEVPEHIRKKLHFVFVNRLDEVFAYALRNGVPAVASSGEVAPVTAPVAARKSARNRPNR